MKWLGQVILMQLAALAAPVVTLFYRKGIWVTPDDPVSPYGQYEPFMQTIYKRMGTFFGDYWWLGWRNRAYGLAYKFKPQHFKNLDTYKDCKVFVRYPKRWIREIEVDGYLERTFFFKFFHVITGYRLRPISDEYLRCLQEWKRIPTRPFNMDARPIFSIRFGGRDD